mgnify:CR=1 FL=1
MDKMILNYLNSVLISSIVVLIISLIYLGLRKFRIIKLDDKYQNFDVFMKKLLLFSGILIFIGLIFIIPKSIKENRVNDKLAQNVQSGLSEIILQPDSDTIVVFSGLEILIPKDFSVSYSKISENSEIYQIGQSDSLKAMRVILLVDRLSNNQKFSAYVTDLVNLLNQKADYNFTKSKLNCDYKFSYVRDYEKTYDSDKKTYGSIIIIGANFLNNKVQKVYFINFEGEGYEKADIEKMIKKINSAIFIKGTQVNMLKNK